MSWQTRPIGASDGDALARLFERTGSSCYCRWWHFSGDKNAWLARAAHAPADSRGELLRAVAGGSDEALGVVAVEHAEIVGWMKLAPAAALAKLYASRPYRGMRDLGSEREGVWTIGCFLVDERQRRRGLSVELVRAGLQLATARGAVAVEAFPRRADGLAPEERWTGSYGALLAAGFVVIHDYAQYPVMRCTLPPAP
ncbi:MAG: GNAT family N-acetyltransferase [Polyangiaceae bacterium]|nr:GNAT family N-acetyltransferase [Polyangiaceae bacterium]